MAYRISDLCKEIITCDLQVSIENEKAFNRFSRATASTEEETCIYILEKKYLKRIPSNTRMIITTDEVSKVIEDYDGGRCICNAPKTLFFRLLNYYNNQVNSKAKVASSFGTSCSISNNATVSGNNVFIGNNVTIEDFATIFPNTVIGDNSIIRSGAKIGIQDYNYYTDGEIIIHIEHAGGVIIGEDVEIGYNSVVGKGLYYGDDTLIDSNCKISHNCCIGHDVRMNKHCMVYSGSVIGGNTSIGEHSRITMNSTIKNGLKIGSGSTICMGSNVLYNVKDGTSVFGNPATIVRV